jgi:50S ribosomal subunit-associated GTPase HflX
VRAGTNLRLGLFSSIALLDIFQACDSCYLLDHGNQTARAARDPRRYPGPERRRRRATYESQLEVSRNVLREIGAEVVPSRLLFNKIDRVSEADRAALRAKHPDAILLSAKSPEDVAALRETIIAFFEDAMVEDQFVLPYAKQGLLGDVYEHARVLSEDYDTTGRIMKVRGLPGAIARLRRTLATS